MKQGGPGRAPLNLHLRDPSSETEQEREDVPDATPESEDFSESRQQPSPTEPPPPPEAEPRRRRKRKAHSGEYTDFDKWLSPTDDAVPGQAVAPKKSRKTKRQVFNLESWLEAGIVIWPFEFRRLPRQRCNLSNIRPSFCQLFSAYPAASALKYDRLLLDAELTIEIAAGRILGPF